ncbi:hypothetical protein H8K32_19860 [Undibacterium jejuense]|uniref:Uncharacterized protein n=1 Tax=Undibacterium jejuense TaxID=1344949 RepID=A0A923KJK3_9BURK|nr:hypothetical protein [Undibacterium jejuense]MBC3864357.1 hypothetical protein [Undibacterium jejuense]
MNRDNDYWTFLKTCSFDDAVKKSVENNFGSAPDSPSAQWYAIREIEALETRFKAGDKFSLLEAIYTCAVRSIPLPDWVERSYIASYRKILKFEAKSLDAAFDIEWKKNINLAAKRKRRKTAHHIYTEIKKMSANGRSVTDELFDEVGAKFNIGRTLAKEYYAYMTERLEKDVAAS